MNNIKKSILKNINEDRGLEKLTADLNADANSEERKREYRIPNPESLNDTTRRTSGNFEQDLNASIRDLKNNTDTSQLRPGRRTGQTDTALTVPTTGREIKDIVSQVQSPNPSLGTEVKVDNIVENIPTIKRDSIQTTAEKRIPDLPQTFSWDSFWKDPMSQLKTLNAGQIAGVLGLLIGGISLLGMVRKWWKNRKAKKQAAENAYASVDQKAASVNTETYFSLKGKDKYSKRFNEVYHSVMTELESRGKK